MKIKKKNIVNNFHLLTENLRLPNMLGQRLYNTLGNDCTTCWANVCTTCWANVLDEQSADGFASRNQRWPNENGSLRPNVGPTSTCYLGNSAKDVEYLLPVKFVKFQSAFAEEKSKMSETRAAIFVDQAALKHEVGRGRLFLAFYHVSHNSVQLL